MKKIIFTFLLIFLVTLHVNAQTTITSWTYDPLNGTASSPTPNIGSGTSAIVNLATPITAQGLSSTTGCGSGNSGNAWQHQNFDPGSSNEVNGVQFKAGTTGYTNIIFTWDLRFSNTAPNTIRLQYTTDGSTWNNFTMSVINTTYCLGSINTNGCYETNTGDSYRRIRVDFTSITAANNNPNFGVRLLASYYQSSGQYRQSTTPASVTTGSGTWRFDNVSFLGTPTSTGAVISGSTSICSGGSANINVTITGGTSPYTVVYSPDGGTTQITKTSYTSGSNITVTPASTTTYTIVSVKDSGNNIISPVSGSAVVTVTAGSSPTFTSSATTNSCASTDIVYTTQSGMDNYSWTFLKGVSAAVLNIDYIITAGSTSSETVTVQWVLVSGTATFSATVTYNSCSGASVTSSTTVYFLPSTPTWAAQPSGYVCTNVAQTYTTAASKSNYVWTIPGVVGTDYTVTYFQNVTSVASSNLANKLVITWLTAESKTVTVNYSNQASPNCQSATSLSNTITVLAPPVISSFGPIAAQVLCTGGSFSPLTVVATGSGTLTYTWIRRNPGPLPSGWTGTTAAYQTFTPTLGASGGYTVTVGNGATGCSVTPPIPAGPFTITPASVGGTVSGSATVCTSTANTSLSLSGNTGSVLYWQSSTDSTFATGVSTISNTTTSLTATGVTTTTYYRAVVQNSTCSTANSASGNITVSSATWNGSSWINGPPTSTKQVVFDSDYTSAGSGAGDLEACSLKVNSNKNVVVSPGDTFNVQNEVIVDASATPGILNFESGSSLVQVNSVGVINTVNIRYKRNVSGLNGYDYVYWSSPVYSTGSNGQLLDGIYSSPAQGYKYKWDPTATNANSTQGNWISASGDYMIPGKGYIVRTSSSYGLTNQTINADFTGVPNNGTLSLPINRGSLSGLNDNYNLLGNPYPSSISIIKFLQNNTSIDGNVSLWKHTNAPTSSTSPFYQNFQYNYYNDYITVNGTGGSNSTTTPYYIGAGQGFYVSMSENPVTDYGSLSGSITFLNSMRDKTYDNSIFYKSASEKNRIWLDLLDSNNNPIRTLIGYVENATNDEDRMYDAEITMGPENKIYSVINNKPYIIQGKSLPFDINDQVPLGITIDSSGAYKIAINEVDGLFEQGQSIYLEDKLLHVIFNLRQAPYVFTTDQGTFNDRFVLRYTDTSLSNSDFSDLSSSIVVFKSHDFVTIQSDKTLIGEVVVYDIQGRIIHDFKNLTTSEFQFSVPTAQQVLVLKIITANNLSFYRKILN
ncbi:MAG: hypothetical protein ACOYLT_06860 [Flavobacterium sp.]|uniref:hypothetical protein n=1 Tax=Flavobacterium sp. TaxID=239 RepID=UPI003BD4DB78